MKKHNNQIDLTLLQTLGRTSATCDQTNGVFLRPLAFPAMRLLYNKTLDTFPAAEVLLSASILIIGTFVNFLIYTQRWRISLFTSQNNEVPKITQDTDK